MKYREFGRTGVKVSEVGLGTWQLGAADWGNVSDDDALRILHRSADLGVNFFDTADVYGMGKSEQYIGRFLKETKHKVHIATKLGRRGDAPNGWPQNFTLAAARRHTQESLQRLGVTSVFLQQWHCIPTAELKKGEVFEHMRTLKKEGLIQHWGVSVESVEEAMICMKHPDCASLQVIYNIYRQKLNDQLLPQARATGTAILARVPLASGLLSGRFTKDTKFDAKDHRHYNADGQKFNVGETFAGLPFAKGVEVSEKTRGILQPTDKTTMAQLALRWILDQPGVSTVIPGATKLKQAEDNAAVSELPALKTQVHQHLADLYQREVKPHIRGPY